MTKYNNNYYEYIIPSYCANFEYVLVKLRNLKV